MAIILGEPLLREADVARALSQTLKAFQAARRAGLGPPYIRAGHKTVLYRPVDVETWLSARYVAPVAAEQDREATAA